MKEIFKLRLRDEIKQCGMSKKELAEALGVSPEMITQYCTTGKMPKLETFFKLCRVLDVSADYLLGIKDF